MRGSPCCARVSDPHMMLTEGLLDSPSTLQSRRPGVARFGGVRRPTPSMGGQYTRAERVGARPARSVVARPSNQAYRRTKGRNMERYRFYSGGAVYFVTFSIVDGCPSSHLNKLAKSCLRSDVAEGSGDPPSVRRGREAHDAAEWKRAMDGRLAGTL